jgi:hypothetical protein
VTPRGQQGVAGGDRPHPADQLHRLGALDQEAAGADPQRLEDVLVEVEGGEDDDPDRRQQLVGGDLPGRLRTLGGRVDRRRCGISGGWSFYVKDGKPKYCHNLVGLRQFSIEADRAVSAGTHQLRAGTAAG